MTFKAQTVVRLLGIMMLVCLTGCPDRSYQAPLPDYSNMTDGGGENTEDSESAQ